LGFYGLNSCLLNGGARPLAIKALPGKINATLEAGGEVA